MLSRQIAVLFFLIAATNAFADDWLTGRAFDQAIAQPTSITWDNGPRIEFLSQLISSSGVALFVDRRVDPSKLIHAAIDHQDMLAAVFVSGADDQIGACTIGSAVYVGPGDVVVQLPWRLRELRCRLGQLPTAGRKTWQHMTALRLPRLTQPAAAIAALATDNGVQIRSIESIPHDLMCQVDLPPMTLAERMAILLVGFGKWPEVSQDGTTMTIVDFPAPEEFDASYVTSQPKDIVQWAKDQKLSAAVVASKNAIRVRVPRTIITNWPEKWRSVRRQIKTRHREAK